MWMGLEAIYQLSNQKNYTLRVTISDYGGITLTAFYSNFSLTENVSSFQALSLVIAFCLK